jgi:hypothetical protein
MPTRSAVPMHVPAYIAASRCWEAPLQYAWDDGDLEPFESPVDEALHARLEGLSQRANVAWCIACAEWIGHRLGPHLYGDPLPFQRLEAAWAQVIDARYSFALTDPPERWAGPVKRPVLRALELIDFAVDAAERDDVPADISATLARLAEHVMDDPSPLRAWQEAALSRLRALYPFDPEESLGDVVPREALDPGRAFEPGETPRLIADLLTRLHQSDNPFLRSRREMLARGFEGVPYVFDSQADHDMRFRW